jgi:hypothetical protein
MERQMAEGFSSYKKIIWKNQEMSENNRPVSNHEFKQ